MAGFSAGVINTVVGSGSLISFPLVVAVGFSPLQANIANTVGLVPGSVVGAWAYRRELGAQKRFLLWLAAVALLGGVVGALMLLVLPSTVFSTLVPILIGLACLLVAVQPWLIRQTRLRTVASDERPMVMITVGVFATSVYGGYFSAAQGVLLIAMLGLLLVEPLQRINGIKNVLQAVVNLAAASFFVFRTNVAWAPVTLIAAGSIAGAFVGASLGRRLPPGLLRALVVAIGFVAVVTFVF